MMANYTKILLATDFSDYSGKTAVRAKLMADEFGCELGIVHVVEPPPMTDPIYGSIFPLDFDFIGQLLEVARTNVAKISEKFGIPKDFQWVELGNPKAEIVRLALEQGFDLIVVGTHGRHGIGALLGSTASSVIHHASCDVLVVRLTDGQAT